MAVVVPATVKELLVKLGKLEEKNRDTCRFIQVFNKVNSKLRDKLYIKKIKLFGEGGQGFEYLV